MAHTSWRILKREKGICDERKESLVPIKKRNKKFNKISRVLVRLFNRYFILKNLIKFIKILFKKTKLSYINLLGFWITNAFIRVL